MSEKAVMPEYPDTWSGFGAFVSIAKKDYDVLRAYATALREENERLKKDAARYQWIRDNNEHHCDEELPHVCINAVTDWGNHYSKFLTPEELDAAIDAAKGDGNG